MELPSGSTNMTCFDASFHVNSKGILIETDNPDWWLNKSFPLFELQMVLIFGLTSFFHFCLKKLGATKIASQILTGLVLGISWKRWDAVQHRLFVISSQEILGTVAFFTYTLYLFITGVKMDITMLARTGRKAIALGFISLFLPILTGTGFRFLIAGNLSIEEKDYLHLVVTLQARIAFPVISSLLHELRIVNSELGRLGLASALVSDLSSLFLSAISTLIINPNHSNPYANLAAMIIFLLFVYGIRQSTFWVIRRTPEGKPVNKDYIDLIIWLFLVSGLVSALFNQYVPFGPYVLALALPAGPPFGSALVQKLECFTMDILVPLFATVAAIRVDLVMVFQTIWTSVLMICTGVLSTAIFVFKVIGFLVPSLFCKLPFNDSLALGLIMNAKGIVDIAAYVTVRENQLLPAEIFDILIIATLITAIILPITVHYLIDPSRKYMAYQNRTIMNMKPNSQLRVLTSINRNDNVSSIINLLHAMNPTTVNPMAVFVLHLIELIGRSSPIFISHKLQKNTDKNEGSSYSEEIIISFTRFEKENPNAVYVESFTAISPLKLMHEDIFILSLDKLISLIILPFHRTWSLEGDIQVDDNVVRNLNLNVLRRAPCSVAIYVDQGRLGRLGSSSSASRKYKYSICLIFLGGKDDREALSFAKIIAKNGSVCLSVLRLVPPDEDGIINDWDKMLDAEILKDIKFNSIGDGHVIYVEEIVKDGPETATVLKSMVEDNYDLVIVGRRNDIKCPQTSGLIEWSEFPELGIIGDLLISADMHSRSSILVVQQQNSVSN